MRDPDYDDRFFELIHRAEDARYGPDTGPWLEQAYRLADEQNDPEYGLLARYYYVFAVAPIEPANAVVAFTWITAHEEHASPLIPMTWIVHLYGIIGGILRSYPDYSLAQIDQTFERMEARFRELGLPMRDVWHHRIYEALGTGHRERAAEWFARWDATLDRAPGTCPVCDLGTRVIYHLFLEDYERGFRLAQPILDGLRCAEGQPLMAASACTIPFLRTGDLERAAHSYRLSVAELDTISYAGIWAAGRQLGYLACVGELDDAVASFNRYFSTAWTSGTPADRYGYLISARMLGRRLVEHGAAPELRVPPTCPLYRPEGTYDPQTVTRFFDREIARLGGRFDERNGNAEFVRIAAVNDAIFEDVRAQVRR